MSDQIVLEHARAVARKQQRRWELWFPSGWIREIILQNALTEMYDALGVPIEPADYRRDQKI